MSGIIDFHSHILPSVDDGSRSVEESLAMLRMEARQDICQVVATPHFYAHRDNPHRFLTRRQHAVECLREAMSQESGLPALHLGAEVAYFSGISNSELLQELTIQGSRCILIEMPETAWSAGVYQELEDIPAKLGLTPIIAHIERCLRPFDNRRMLQALQSLPVLIQSNAGFFLRWNTRGTALRMLRQGQIHLLGSDCHNLTSRQPNLRAAADVIRQRLGPQALEQIAANQKYVLSAPKNTNLKMEMEL